MKTLPASGSQLFDAPVFNAQVPQEGPKAVAIQVPFTSSDTQFKVSMLLTQSQQLISLIQSVFVDNRNNPESVTLTTGVLNQNVVIPPASQAYVPLLAPKNADIVLSSSGKTTVNLIFLNVPVPAAVWSVNNPTDDYATVAASQSATALGLQGGAIGDYLDTVLIIPATTSPGAVQIKDGSTTITIFTGGGTSVSNLVPFPVPLQAVSRNGAWSIITGANVSVIAQGRFT